MNDGIFLLLGSNLGNPLLNLSAAASHIQVQAGRIVKRSSIYKTAAWGMSDQPEFYNQVLEIESPYKPDHLLAKLLQIEEQMGRVRLQKWGPRIIDIDILFYGQHILSSEGLKLPHPGIPERRFTLEPLAELASAWRHPVLGKSMAELLAACEDHLSVQKLP